MSVDPKQTCLLSHFLPCATVTDGAETMANEQQRQPIEERIGSMVGKIIVLAICAMILWGYSTTFLAQVRLL
jgi:hypothetical protein